MSLPPQPGPPVRPTPAALKAARDRAKTSNIVLIATLAALGSVLFSTLSGSVAGDVCRDDCGTRVNVTIIGVWWGGIVLSALVGRIGIRSARRRGEPASVWASTALLLVIASTVVGQLTLNAVSGMG